MSGQREIYIKTLQAENAAMRATLRRAADYIKFWEDAEYTGAAILKMIKNVTGYDPSGDHGPLLGVEDNMPGSSEPPATETKAATDDRVNGNYCYDPNPLVIGGRDRD